jgi:hypothetical protein
LNVPLATDWCPEDANGELARFNRKGSQVTGDGAGFGEGTEQWIDDLLAFDHEVVVLPEALEGDVGVYRDELSSFAKEMRAAGLDAAYLHDQGHRTWSGRKGGPILVPILLAIGESSIPSALFFFLDQWLSDRFPSSRVSVRIVHKARGSDERTKDILKISAASGVEAAKAIREFERGRSEAS